jgi:hypothetical protein
VQVERDSVKLNSAGFMLSCLSGGPSWGQIARGFVVEIRTARLSAGRAGLRVKLSSGGLCFLA